MAFHSVVLVKQVPDTKAVGPKAMNDDGTVNRSALPAVFNPEDKFALEAALQIKDRLGGTVTAITMGPPQACDVLRECLYLGADRVIMLTDRRAAASDTLATSYILSCAVRKLGKVDLVSCGRQAIDGDTAQVGPQCAEKLGLPQVTYLEEIIDVSEKSITARRNVGNGYEIVECSLPALVTVTDTFAEPRPRAAKAIMKWKHVRAAVELQRDAAAQGGDKAAQEAYVNERVAELQQAGMLIEQWNLDDIEADLQWCGRDGSPTKVKRIQSVVLKGAGYNEFQNSDEDMHRLVHMLIEDHTIG